VSWYNHRMKVLFITLCLVLSITASEWSLVKESEGVRVYTSPVEGSDFLAYRGETVVEGSVASIVAVLYDTPNCVSWLHECSFGVTLEEVSFEENYIFEQYDLTFPVSDRGVILHSTLEWDKGHAVVRIKEDNAYCDENENLRCAKVRALDLIPITRSRGAYTLTYIDEQRTSVVWQVHAEPGGKIPTWIVNMMVIDMPYYSLLHLRTIVKEEKYRDMTQQKLRKLWQGQYDEHH